MAHTLGYDPVTGDLIECNEDELRNQLMVQRKKEEHWKQVARSLAELVVNEDEATVQYAKLVLRAVRK
jgi:hypothetical protein